MAELHRGKLATEPKIIEIRPLTRDDLACLREKRPAQNAVKTFREWHHRVARLVAMGLKAQEVCTQAGLSRTRYLQYMGDPAFCELVAQYRNKVDEGYIDAATELYETVAANTLNAERMIAETLEEALDGGERPSLKTLLAISRDGADRVGLPKQKVSQNTNINLDFAGMLERAAVRSGRSNVIDAVPMRTIGPASGPRVSSPPTVPSAQSKPPSDAGAGLIRRRA